jgi:hypothetical protein
MEAHTTNDQCLVSAADIMISAVVSAVIVATAASTTQFSSAPFESRTKKREAYPNATGPSMFRERSPLAKEEIRKTSSIL